MGRDAGHLALHSALAGNADVCLIPEIPYSLDGIINKLKEIKARGRNHAIIVVSESIKTENGGVVTSNKNMVGEAVYGGIGQYLCAEVAKRYNEFQFRVTTLGHLQRSGVPVAFDRLLASVFGAKAVELLDKGEDNKMVIWKDGKVDAVSLSEVVKAGTTLVDTKGKYVKAAKDLGMYIGEI
jgi:6-phosphofructokinase 1